MCALVIYSGMSLHDNTLHPMGSFRSCRVQASKTCEREHSQLSVIVEACTREQDQKRTLGTYPGAGPFGSAVRTTLYGNTQRDVRAATEHEAREFILAQEITRSTPKKVKTHPPFPVKRLSGDMRPKNCIVCQMLEFYVGVVELVPVGGKPSRPVKTGESVYRHPPVA